MAAELHPKTPSPEFIVALTWMANNLWAAVCFLIVILGRIVFGNLAKEIKQISEQNSEQNKKLDTMIGTVNQLGREISEIKGELKAKDNRP